MSVNNYKIHGLPPQEVQCGNQSSPNRNNAHFHQSSPAPAAAASSPLVPSPLACICAIKTPTNRSAAIAKFSTTAMCASTAPSLPAQCEATYRNAVSVFLALVAAARDSASVSANTPGFLVSSLTSPSVSRSFPLPPSRSCLSGAGETTGEASSSSSSAAGDNGGEGFSTAIPYPRRNSAISPLRRA